MPALTREAGPALGHVNMMVDTLIANASLQDLRALVRSTLATTPPSVAAAFTCAARKHFEKSAAASCPLPEEEIFARAADGTLAPTDGLRAAAARARVLLGCGMGFRALGVLRAVVQASLGGRWEAEGEMEDVLAMVDADVAQAIQSAKEELEAGRVADVAAAREAARALQDALRESRRDVGAWGGEFPFERALDSIEQWKF